MVWVGKWLLVSERRKWIWSRAWLGIIWRDLVMGGRIFADLSVLPVVLSCGGSCQPSIEYAFLKVSRCRYLDKFLIQP